MFAEDGRRSFLELIETNDERYPHFHQQHALIYKIKARKWELSRWENSTITRDRRHVITYHSTLKEAKALGIVEARFKMANKL